MVRQPNILTDILLFERLHRIADIQRDVEKQDPTKGLGRDDNGSLMRKEEQIWRCGTAT